MVKNVIKSVLLLLLSILSGKGFAQEGGTSDENIKPNQGQTHGINGAYNPNYFDGSININVPIYSYEKDLNFGVSLSYNTRGVPIDEISEITGLHWSLNVGPSIQRVVKDIPDEINYETKVYAGYDPDSMYFGTEESGFYNYHKYVKGKLATYGETLAEQTRNNVYRDGECDDFILELGGYSVTFNLGNNGYVFTHPKRDITVQATLDGVPINNITSQINGSTTAGNKLGFVVTEESGNKYYFIPGEIKDKEYFDNTYWDGDLDLMLKVSQINRWVVDKIIFSDGNVISYSYSPSFIPSTYIIDRSYSVNEIGTTATYVGLNEENFSGWKKQLQSIKYPNNTTVNFSYHSTNKNEADEPIITQISASEAANCINYQFYYTASNGRWYLDEIRKKGCGMTSDKPYFSFEYEDEYTLPARLNGGKDLMGYFNADSIGVAIGSSGNKITTPAHNWTTGLPNYGLSRFTVYWRAKASLLNKITNEYGGSAQFYYSGNAAVPVLSGLPTSENYLGKNDCYGLKVDSIVEVDPYEPASFLKRIKISYTNGQIFIPGGYFHYPTYINSSNVWEKVTYQSNYLTSHDLVHGSNHGYSNVTIKEFNSANQLLGRTDVKFTNINDSTASSPRYYTLSGGKKFFEYPYTNKQYLKDWEIGLPLEITSYDHNEKIIEKAVNTYSFSATDLTSSASISNQKRIKVSTGALTTPDWGTGMPQYYANKKLFTDSYYPFTGYADLIRTVKHKYATDTRVVSDTIWNTFDNKRNLKTQITRNSAGEKATTRYIYNYDVDGPSSPYTSKYPGTAIYDMTKDKLERVVSVERWDEENTGTKPYSNTLLDADITVYQYQNGKVWVKERLNLYTDVPISYTDYTGISSGSSTSHPYNKVLSAQNTTGDVNYFERSSGISGYDAKGNATEKRFLNRNAYTATIWDTTSGNMLAIAKGALYAEIAYSSFEDLYNITTGNVNRANLQFRANKVIAGTSTIKSVTGKFIYQLTTAVADSSNILGTNSLIANKEYILSFWSRGGIPKVYIGTTLLTAPASSASIGSWNNYIYRFTPSIASKIKIAPATTTAYIDDVRLFPSNTEMYSGTYEPLFGLNSYTDERGRIIYIEYDALGNQTVIRDQSGNVLQKNKYYYIGGDLY